MGRWWYLQWILEVVKIEMPARKMKDGTEVKQPPYYLLQHTSDTNSSGQLLQGTSLSEASTALKAHFYLKLSTVLHEGIGNQCLNLFSDNIFFIAHRWYCSRSDSIFTA